MGHLGERADQAERCAEVLKAVAHPLRLRIIALLCEEDQHVTSLATRLEASQPAVSQQLRILRMKELVQVHRHDGYSVYSLAEPHLVEMVRCVERCDQARAERGRRSPGSDSRFASTRRAR